ncbi:hypothetical protein BDV10DRAFT_186180 [Aspergillus recurvatus]
MPTVAVLSAAGGIVMVVALATCTIHPENLLQPLRGMVILQICSVAWTPQPYIIVCIIYVAMTVNGLATQIIGCSRLIWAFAREGGLQFPRSVSQVNSTLDVPVNAVGTSCVLCLAFGPLVLGPETVLGGLSGMPESVFRLERDAGGSHARPSPALCPTSRAIPQPRWSTGSHPQHDHPVLDCSHCFLFVFSGLLSRHV